MNICFVYISFFLMMKFISKCNKCVPKVLVYSRNWTLLSVRHQIMRSLLTSLVVLFSLQASIRFVSSPSITHSHPHIPN